MKNKIGMYDNFIRFPGKLLMDPSGYIIHPYQIMKTLVNEKKDSDNEYMKDGKLLPEIVFKLVLIYFHM